MAEQIEHWANIGKMMEENQDLLIKLYAALRCDSSDESV
ncbi:TA system antitoxin ParD family protein [Vibrio alginolyticus]